MNLKRLEDLVVSRGSKAGNVVVIRPDSGDPATVVCKILNILGDKFGSTKNSKGFKVLPPYLRILQGDGIGIFKFYLTNLKFSFRTGVNRAHT